MSNFKHKSVLLAETVSSLNLKKGMTVVDATFGGGGHTAAVLNLVGVQGRVYAFDQDAEAISFGKQKFSNISQLSLINENFADIKKVLINKGVEKIDAVLFDLGVSSYQLENIDRGFSWKDNCLLDMRMDQSKSLDAIQVLNKYSQDSLAKIFKDYGEERYAKDVARKIVEYRKDQKIEYSEQLKKIVLASVRGDYQSKTTSISRIFQAVRIEVNQELAIIQKTLEEVVSLLSTGGRVAVISFHSLEDRIVKQTFQKLSRGCSCPPNFPKCVCGEKKLIKIVTKKPLLPSLEEINDNVRARSAKLRVAEKIDVSG